MNDEGGKGSHVRTQEGRATIHGGQDRGTEDTSERGDTGDGISDRPHVTGVSAADARDRTLKDPGDTT